MQKLAPVLGTLVPLFSLALLACGDAPVDEGAAAPVPPPGWVGWAAGVEAPRLRALGPARIVGGEALGREGPVGGAAPEVGRSARALSDPAASAREAAPGAEGAALSFVWVDGGSGQAWLGELPHAAAQRLHEHMAADGRTGA